MRLLCIDDEPIRFTKLAKLHDCFVTDNAKVIELYLNSYKFDAVLLDHDMPHWTGVDVARVYLVEKNIPVIVHSANDIGANQIMLLLEEYAVPCFRWNVMERNWAKTIQKIVEQFNS